MGLGSPPAFFQAADQSKRVDPAGIENEGKGVVILGDLFIYQIFHIIFTTLNNILHNCVKHSERFLRKCLCGGS